MEKDFWKRVFDLECLATHRDAASRISGVDPAAILEVIGAVRNLDAEYERKKTEMIALEKEADWLANILANDCAGGCGSCVVCGIPEQEKGLACLKMTKEKWREAAKKTAGGQK